MLFLSTVEVQLRKAVFMMRLFQLEYTNSSCSENKEQSDKSCRPEIAEPMESIDSYIDGTKISATLEDNSSTQEELKKCLVTEMYK